MTTARLTALIASLVLPLIAVAHAGAQQPDGKQLYLKNCKRCHGVLGTPTKDALREDDKIPALNDPQLYAKRVEKELFKSIKEGKGRNMKAFDGKMTDAEIEAVVQYIRTLVKEK